MEDIIVRLDLTRSKVVLVTAILVALLFLGMLTQNFTLLRYVLLLGMILPWTLLLEGVLYTIIPQYADMLEDAEGIAYYTIMALTLAMAGGVFLIFAGYAGIQNII